MKILNIPSAAAQVLRRAPGLDSNPVARAGAPIALTSEIQNLAAGQTQIFPTLGLQPGNRTPYWIDEVRMTLHQLDNDGIPDPLVATAFDISLQFETGSYKVSRLPVPMPLYAPIYGSREFVRDQYDTTQFGDTYIATNYRWVLPRPLYMPAGDVLQCRAARSAAIFFEPTAQMLAITYIGRAEAPGTPPPAKRDIPWVAHYLHANSATYTETNDEFRNPFLSKLRVQRFICRQTYATALSGTDPNYNQIVGYGQQEPASGITAPWVEMKMQDSLGYAVVPNMTPIGNVFDPQRACWTFNRDLSPREKFQMAFQTYANSSSKYMATYVSMVGSREENV